MHSFSKHSALFDIPVPKQLWPNKHPPTLGTINLILPLCPPDFLACSPEDEATLDPGLWPHGFIHDGFMHALGLNTKLLPRYVRSPGAMLAWPISQSLG